MAEYIDREEYCEKHCRCSNEYCDKESCPIWKAPAADVAPVVHGCWEKGTRDDGFCFSRYVVCGSLTPRRNPTDFCSYGERKEPNV